MSSPAHQINQIKFVTEALRRMGADWRRAFGELERMQSKGENLQATVDNMEAELGKAYKSALSAAEEKIFMADKSLTIKQLEAEEACWLILPIFGKTNLLHARHECGSLFLFLRKGVADMGICYMPGRDITVTAAQGGGIIEEVKIRIGGRSKLEGSVAAFNALDNADMLAKLQDAGTTIRVSGAPVTDALDVAAGRADVMIAKNVCIACKLWAQLVIKESGGFISNETGKYITSGGDWVVGGNSKLHGAALKLFK